MKTSSVNTTAVAILAALLPYASANTCDRQENAVYTYSVSADGVDDIPGKCGGLWDNLKRFSACVASSTSCDGEDGNLNWSFDVGKGCDGGMVESSWYEATSNDFGGIDCP